MSDPKKFHVKVRDTENVIYEGDVDRINSFNEMGPFDVYPMHANFISILRQEVTLYNNHEKVKEMKFEQAVLKVKQDQAEIYLGIEVLFMQEDLTPTPLKK
jgi:F0F1-type ATP synthase epsilon subunit